MRGNAARCLVAIPILLGLFCAPALQAQRGGGGGGGGGGKSGGGQNSSKDSDDDDTGVPVCPQITGQHPLLETLTRELSLTCEQEVRILPQVHDEEAVSKPLLAYPAFTPEERQAMLLQVEIAVRTRVRQFVSPEQQKKIDAETARLENKPPKANKKKMPPVSADAFASEEDLSGALDSYSALTVTQKKEMILQVKRAARREGAPTLTADQAAKIDADIALLQH